VLRYIEDLETIRDALGVERWIVGGHSWGASLALQYTLSHPERTLALVYISGTGIGREWSRAYHFEADRRRTPIERARLDALTNQARSPAEESEYRLLSWRPDFAAPDHAVDLIAEFDEPFEINRDANRLIMRETKAWIESDLARQCSAMVAPTLVLHGERDPRPAWAVDSLVAALPNASIEVLPGVGHLPWLESPEVFAQRLQLFLQAR
jgi:proline iminopeptidase